MISFFVLSRVLFFTKRASLVLYCVTLLWGRVSARLRDVFSAMSTFRLADRVTGHFLTQAIPGEVYIILRPFYNFDAPRHVLLLSIWRGKAVRPRARPLRQMTGRVSFYSFCHVASFCELALRAFFTAVASCGVCRNCRRHSYCWKTPRSKWLPGTGPLRNL